MFTCRSPQKQSEARDLEGIGELLATGSPAVSIRVEVALPKSETINSDTVESLDSI